MSAKAEADEQAKLVLDRAKIESTAMKHRARAELREQSKQFERRAEDLQSARNAFEHEKRTIMRETVLRAASITVRVLIGVLTGSVRFDDKRLELQFDDLKLARDVERLEVAPTIQKAVVLLSKVWTRLTSLLSASDIEKEREHQAKVLKSAVRPPSGGTQP